MEEPLENEYFNWLCAKVLERHGRMYYGLLGILYKTEFIWVIDADSHRAADGIELRQDFLRETYQKSNPHWYAEPCSVLEMFIAFARRASFQTDTPSKDWFWTIMANLQLDQFRQLRDEDVPIIKNILYRFLSRSYDSHGYGGMFPITITHNDQRYVEILYQFHEYLFNHNYV